MLERFKRSLLGVTLLCSNMCLQPILQHIRFKCSFLSWLCSATCFLFSCLPSSSLCVYPFVPSYPVLSYYYTFIFIYRPDEYNKNTILPILIDIHGSKNLPPTLLFWSVCFFLSYIINIFYLKVLESPCTLFATESLG